MILEFFTDPVLRAPTWGCILMCIASSLMGVLILLKRQSLISESLAHATYPGACLGIALFGFLFPGLQDWSFLAVLIGAFFSSLLGLKAIQKMKNGPPDAALTLVLSTFFGCGILIVSWLQAVMPVCAKQTQMLLFGQAATMSDIHIWIYGAFAMAVILFLLLTFRPLQATLFDPQFAQTTRIPVAPLEKILFWFLLVSLIIGIRSVGVVLMSGMAIAPAVAARQFSDRLQTIFLLAALFGALSAFLGNIGSVWLNLPTGPAIVIVGALFAFLSLLFAPLRGLLFRLYRIGAFRLRCVEENLLKTLWKKRILATHSWTCKIALWRLQRAGWVDANRTLTDDGAKKAASIIRLHRLWELYLTEELGVQAEKVHRTAEEMEHIITPEMEERLTRLLENPKHDPHHQPIPERER
ncbi:MAG: metal ABC transporter permease [Verrucomicrobia bacterium]|nr:metal ABC transporter permease [Verrucomicrobiota bacterium]MDE3047001.1 metal ABC transporter permease [Verrucomicrobiota bacterium]